MPKFNSIEELNLEREKLDEQFDGGLPDYMKDYFDNEEIKIVETEFYREKWRAKYNTPVEERREYKQAEVDEFWKNNKAEIFLKPETLGSHLEPVYQPPARATERVEEEVVLSYEEKQALIRLCEDDLELFAVRYFPHYLKKPSSKLHKFLYKTLTKEINDTKREDGFKWAIAAPRHNAKSSIVSAILPLWCICYNKKRFICIISDTADQAQDFLSDIKSELTDNEMLASDFPYAVGKGDTWRLDSIVTPNGVKIMALGTGNKIRGRRFGIHRPDLIVCHEKDTEILYNNKWIKIQDHPSATEKKTSGYKIKISGLPFTETVTEDHQYYVKVFHRHNNENKEIYTDWKSADELENSWKYKHYIGYKIDYSILNPEPIEVYYPGSIQSRDDLGKIKTGSGGFYCTEVPDEFYDKDFWWMVGVWWGDGHILNDHVIGFTIAYKDDHIYQRILKIANKYNRIVSKPITKQGCFQITISWSHIVRWLHTWKYGNSMKKPPEWVEFIDYEYQKELIKGYIAADGFIDKNQIRLTSIYLDGLLSVRRILMRLGICSSIRHGVGERPYEINGRSGISKKKYDLRFRQGADILGYNIDTSNRYLLTRQFIKDGYMWNKFQVKHRVIEKIFIPIKTDDSTYTTHFGLSHNCDDLENSDIIRSKTQRHFIRYTWFDKDVAYVGGEKGSRTDFVIVGTVLSKDSLLNALLDSEEYPEFKSMRFAAVQRFSESDLWIEWEKLLKNRLDVHRTETAYKFFEEHKDEMLKNTRVLWPEGDPYYDLMVQKATKPSAFITEKQNAPVDTTKIYITREELHFESFISNPDIKKALSRRRSEYFGAIDPSVGKKNMKGDYSAIITLAKDKVTGFIYVVDMDLKRRSVDDQINDIMKAHEKHHYKVFGVETNAFQYVLAESLRKRSRSEGVLVPIKEIQTYSDKKARFEGMLPFLTDGTIVFDSRAANYNSSYALGIEQICTFTGENDEHDDAPDGLELAFSVCRAKRFKMITRSTR